MKMMKRVLSLVLCLSMLAAWIPVGIAGVSAAEVDSRVADPATLNHWEEYFGSGNLSTEFAGGVWTDKSVMTDASQFRANIPMQDKDNHFLIALSAIAANQQIVGYNTAPVDVMLVLDVSGSMEGSKATTMVQAANETLESLQNMNNNNRVGVVLYSGNSSTNQNAGTNTATVLLPLDRYTTTATQTVGTGANRKTIPAYLSISNNMVSIPNTVRNSSGRVTGSKNVVGGTYIQNGLYKAWGEFSKVTDVKVPAGQAQAGAQRTPVMVLLSDGQPTLATAAYNNVGTSERTYGDGQESNTSWRTVFLSQLTAAWVKGKMTAKYGTNAKFYTLGLGTGASNYATAVLDPSNATNYTLASYWSNFFDEDRLDGNGNVSISGTWRVAKDSSVASKDYVDLYKLATNTSDLLAAFQQIVETIELDTAGHVTLVEGLGEDLSGYITFTDELGMFMEVKDMKGLVLGDTLYTGAKFAQKLGDGSYGSIEDPTDLGDEFIRSVRERLSLDVTTAQSLVAAAYADGQIAYTSASDFSNYLGWYSDSNGTYLGFWDKDTGITAEGAPAGATWINKSYLFQDTVADSDFMHIVVRVYTHIESGMQVVQYKIPASLIPKVTYEVELTGANDTEMKSLTRKEAFPLRLVYEVGLQDEINAINVADKLQEAIDAGYGHAHTEDDGSYAFYTNLWGAEHGDTTVDYTDPMNHNVAQSHFHPAEGNDRYYYTVDTLIYSDANGTKYNGAAAPTGNGYYRAHHYYTTQGYTTKYIPIAQEALDQAAAYGRQNDGYWYVPAGTVYQQVDRFKQHKDPNATGTLEYYDHPVVVKNGEKYDTYAFLGNNGKVTLMPAQGIRLTKTVTETVDGALDSFTFDITLSKAVANPTVTDPDGEPWADWSVSGEVITVTLKAGQTVCITDLPTGVTYSVTERKHEDYVGSSQNATGAVQVGKMNPVDFVNVPKGYGNLIVSKDVDHPFTVVPDALTQKEFTIFVQLTGEDVANKQFAIAGTEPTEYITTNGNGGFTVTLKDNDSLTLVGLPEGTGFTASEILDPDAHKGFTMDADRSVLEGIVVKDSTVQAHVVNVYAPQAPDTAVQVAGQKILTDETGAFNWANNTFTMRLEQYDPATGTYNTLGTKQVSASNLFYLFADEIRLTQLGSFYYKVTEVIPDDRFPGMSYDATAGRFEVVVTDENVDGVMEIAVYDVDTGAQLTANNGVVTYTKDFENIYTTDATYVEFTVDKNVVDIHNTGTTEEGYLFGLYEVIGGVTQSTPAYSMRTVMVDGRGQATFHIPVTKVGTRTFILKEIAPADFDKIPGMIYDTTEYTVVVEGKANEQSKLEASVTIRDASGAEQTNVAFNNVIDLEPVTLNPGVTKELIGREPLNDSEFTFTMVQTDGSFATNIPGGYSSTVSVGNGNKRFDPVELTQVGTYYYRVTEQIGNAGGMTYDNSVYHITVNVTLVDGALQKSATFVKVGQGQAAAQTQLVQFTNTYANNDTAEVTLQGNKTLTGRDLVFGQFRFALSEGQNVLQTVSNRADGSFVFAPITYTAADVGTHVYTISEVNDGLGGITYDTTVYTVTVTVTDNGQGELVVTTEGAEDIAFRNSYYARPVTVSFGGTKTWFNNDTQSDKAMSGGEFTFVLYASDEHFATQGAQVATATNAFGGSFGFDLTYQSAGSYYYLLRERNDADPTVSYDTATYQIKIHVYDNGAGQLIGAVESIRRVGNDSDTISFVNGYTPKPVEQVISGTKVLTGRDLASGEFSFQLIQDGEVLQTVTNTEEGFAFDTIAYHTSGTYTYQVKELIPEQAVDHVYNGVTYDTTVFDVTVTVTDVDGQLTATVNTAANGSQSPLQFVNEYNITKFTDFDLEGQKWLYRGNAPIGLGNRSFRFAILDDSGAVLQTVTADADGKFLFENVPLTETGLNTFTVVELAEDLGGITYDSTVYTVTVDVADNGLGDLIAGLPVVTLNGQDAQLRFNNTYTLEPTELALQVQKVLEGKNLQADQFSFELYDSEGNLLQTKTNTSTGEVTFDAIEYTMFGTYAYTVRELVPDGPKNGISYDSRVIEITVTVVDNGNGTMTATAQYAGGPVFTNVYTVTGEPMFSISGSKELTGRELASGEFTFLLTGHGKNLETTNVGGGFSFQNVELPGLGTYTFTVTEKNNGLGGVSYDDAVYTVTVTVTDDGFGGMNVSTPEITLEGEPARLVFTNGYTAKPATYQPEVTKQYNRPMSDGQFSFTLTGEGVAQAKSNAADGTVTFEPLTFTQAGTYTYTVKELKGDASYITYDETVYTLVITVTDDGEGQLHVESATVNGSENTPMVFTNTYNLGTTSLALEVSKVLENKALTAGQFTFTLTGEGVAQTAANAADGKVVFDAIEYTQAGTYTYTIAEQIPDGDKQGITYDDHKVTVTVTVVDNGDGTLTATAQYTGSTVFTNTYTVTGNPVFSISGTKTLTGRELKDGEFTFVLTDAQGNILRAVNENGSFSFTDVALPGLGVHSFTLTEQNDGLGGIRYDATVYTVTVTVTDNGVGGMHVSEPVITAGGQPAQLVFTNDYQAAPAEYTPVATKQYNKPLADGQFSFTISDSEGALQTVTNTADGTVTFDKLTFTQAGTYTYTVKEVKGDASYITYDETVYTLVITVTDDGKGQLHVDDVSITGDAMVFTNTYTAAPTQFQLTGQKNYTKELLGDEFSFVLTGEGVEQTVTNAAGGAITFEALTYTQEGTYTYTVTETNTGKGGVTYDETVYTVTVQIADNGQGQLVVNNVTVSDDRNTGNATVTFNNVYTVTGDPVFSISGTKTLTGRDLVDGEFIFVLTDAQGNAVETSNQGGIFSFTNVALPGLGEHTYTVTERDTGVGTITYDETVYTVTVTVSDDNEGGMLVSEPVITLNGGAAELAFANVYTKPDPITVELAVNKTVTGGQLSPEGFQFALFQGQELLQTRNADADGRAVFSLEYPVEAVGMHELVIREVNTGLAYVTYDTTEYAVTVIITETADGQLAAQLQLNGENADNVAVSFTNHFDPPSTPQTGDSTDVQILMGVMGFGLLGIVTMLFVLTMDRKKSKFGR